MTWVERLKSRNRRLVGLVTAAALAVIVALVGGYDKLGVGYTEYEAELINTGGVRVGDQIRVAGIPVGEVTGLDLEDAKIVMTFRVEDDISVGEHARLEVELATLLGGRHVVLTLPEEDEPPIERIPIDRTTVPYDLSAMIEDVAPTLEELDGAKLRDALTAMTETMSAAEPAMDDALGGIAALTDVVLDRKEQIATLLRSAERMTDLVNANSEELFALMGQADVLLTDIVERKELIRSMLRELRGLTSRLADVFETNRAQLQPMFDNVAAVTAMLREADGSLDQALELFAPTSRYLTNAMGNGPYIEALLPNMLATDNYLCASGAVKDCK